MPYARTRGHVLQLTRPQDGAIAETVPVFKRPAEDVSDDLHIPVAVHPEALTGLHPVVIDDPQRTESHLRRVVVVAKRERVIRVEPTVVEVASLGSLA